MQIDGLLDFWKYLKKRGYPREVNQKIPRNKLENGEDDDADDQFYEEYFDHDLGRDEDEYERHYARIRMLKKRKRKLRGSEKGIVHDNDDVISLENHKVLKNKIGGQPLFISHGWIKWG
ncbi:hypothetical protein IGI04_010580 [Brassica rapa subsp. trilocularis]|uniref:Uncharacterized protein n=1 Tax=Brassica rapa subsp. trilocularis TaxID=1813537 RepID=A0ABQ7N0G1_BRACM|nr:hypothetical protein IGI04_010542 [Brassica rapa subsp. trilocularis]KAG5404461.1 hypothetical protein IGI04_010580 [Brassica rapa subsp. trilocularis]